MLTLFMKASTTRVSNIVQMFLHIQITAAGGPHCLFSHTLDSLKSHTWLFNTHGFPSAFKRVDWMQQMGENTMSRARGARDKTWAKLQKRALWEAFVQEKERTSDNTNWALFRCSAETTIWWNQLTSDSLIVLELLWRCNVSVTVHNGLMQCLWQPACLIVTTFWSVCHVDKCLISHSGSVAVGGKGQVQIVA